MRNKKRLIFIGSALMLIALLSGGALFVTNHTSAKAAGPGASTSYTTLADLGTTGFDAGQLSTGKGNTSKETSKDTDQEPRVANKAGSTHPLPTTAPNPANLPVSGSSSGTQGFEGLNHAQQRLANNGNQFSLEPPDQGLCTNGHYVLEAVNTVLGVYKPDGTLVSGPTALNPFFHFAPEIIRPTTTTPAVYGPFTSDPKCLYDAATNRWFLTILEEDTNPTTGSTLGVRTHTELAVSQTGDPTGKWSLYAIDTTDDGKNGTPSNPNCPCLGDQPLIGADLSGFYITTNEFPEAVNGFNGAQLYAFSKFQIALAASRGSSTLPTVVHINANSLLAPYGGQSYSIQPARGFIGDEVRQNGTEYFLSALDFNAALDNRVAVWGLTNTFTLNLRNPKLNLKVAVVDSETYGQPPNATQKAGPTPLRDMLNQPPTSDGDPLELLNTNDDRMNEVTAANGLLWGAVNTIVQTPGSAARSGVAYFLVRPIWQGDTLGGHVDKQGYVAVAKDNVMFPVITANFFGTGVIGFSTSGPDYYPSTGYVRVNADDGVTGAIHITGVGVAPEDGFTGYNLYGGAGVARWGDYSGAAVAPDGSIWIASEFIGANGNTNRTVLANWSTYVTHLDAFDFGR